MTDILADALLAARLLAIDPGLGGIVVRCSAGPVRDAWSAAYAAMASGPLRRLPAGVGDDRLLGGLDLAATLAAGRPIVARGVLAEADGGSVIVPMAERIDEALAGKLAATLDAGMVTVERDGVSRRHPARIALVLFDEGVDDERVPAVLAERVAFMVDLDLVPSRAAETIGRDASEVATPYQPPELADDMLEAICATALAFGVSSARATMFTVRAARAHAASSGRAQVTTDDVVVAARLVLMPRATRLPAPAEDTPPPPTPEERSEDEVPRDEGVDTMTDLVVDAVRASLPPDVLAALAAGRPPAGRGSGKGAKRKSAARGRPAPSRPGQPSARARLALVDTLRAAAPWQGLRRSAGSTRVVVRREDFRVRCFVEQAESTTVFAVDASGSAAIARLAEAKGAVELLLAEAYVRRTQVALVAFRGTAAELVLPPTRSLARAKRCLGDLAGGGGTPLAAGIDLAVATARAASARGRTPFVVVLTDGRANIARDGTASRDRATADALAAARVLGAERIGAAFIDTAPRPRPEGAVLAAAMGARYAPLPRADATAMAAVVRGLEPGR